MKLNEIKEAVDKGLTVLWKQNNYRVVKWTNGYYVVCTDNNNAIGLTHRDGITMNGNEEDFRILKEDTK